MGQTRTMHTLGASIETPLQSPCGSAKERSTVVSTVKDTRAATSTITKPRLLRSSYPDVLEPRIPRMNTNSALPRGFVAAVYDCRMSPPGAHRDAATAIARQRARASRVGTPRRRGPTCAARPPLHLQQRRCFSPRAALRAGSAAESWDAKGLASLPWNYETPLRS
jgi:hypothetical protein